MSEENNYTVLPAEKDELFENKNGITKDGNHKPALSSDESPASENAEAPAEQVYVQEKRQLIESAMAEVKNKSVLISFECNVQEADQSLEKKVSTSDAASEPISLVGESDADKSLVTSTTSNEAKSLAGPSDGQSSVETPTSSAISASEVPASEKGLKEVTENIQLIYEGLKDMKISALEVPASASGKKGRKPLTPRARSTPVKPITSPPLTRSRSRDLRKFPSTPTSPKSKASRKTSKGDSDEVKGVRGRQREKKNL